MSSGREETWDSTLLASMEDIEKRLLIGKDRTTGRERTKRTNWRQSVAPKEDSGTGRLQTLAMRVKAARAAIQHELLLCVIDSVVHEVTAGSASIASRVGVIYRSSYM